MKNSIFIVAFAVMIIFSCIFQIKTEYYEVIIVIIATLSVLVIGAVNEIKKEIRKLKQ